MLDNGHMNEILMGLNKNPMVITSLVVSRSGMHVAGETPVEVHQETFVAMAAILMSAAETASSNLKGELDIVFVELDRSGIMIIGIDKKRVLVVVTNTNEGLNSLRSQIKVTIDELA